MSQSSWLIAGIFPGIECHKVRGPEGPEDREQQRRIFGRLSQRFGLLDQRACLLRSRLGFRGTIAFDMHEWGDQRDLKLICSRRSAAVPGRAAT